MKELKRLSSAEVIKAAGATALTTFFLASTGVYLETFGLFLLIALTPLHFVDTPETQLMYGSPPLLTREEEEAAREAREARLAEQRAEKFDIVKVLDEIFADWDGLEW